MEELAKTLQSYGGWGVSVLMVAACLKLYADLKTMHSTRVDDLKGHLEKYRDDAVETMKAWQTASQALDTIKAELQRRGLR